jgi:nucleoside 2-deoxyribosyltransferase
VRIFLVCSVRSASSAALAGQTEYVRIAEGLGHEVHYPPRDTNQTACGLDICRENLQAIKRADEVHVWYVPESQGTHFDIGMAFALGKTMRLVNDAPLGEGKSFPRMLAELEGSIEGSPVSTGWRPPESGPNADFGVPQGAWR